VPWVTYVPYYGLWEQSLILNKRERDYFSRRQEGLQTEAEGTTVDTRLEIGMQGP
jgi:hypothetical protein